jgi:hypothetical protein
LQASSSATVFFSRRCGSSRPSPRPCNSTKWTTCFTRQLLKDA